MAQSSNWLNSLVTNPWFGITSFIIGVLGVILTIIFYFKSKKFKRPCYAIRSLGVVEDITNKSKSLEIYYAGQKIERLTITRIAFWNAGNETIDKRDIAPADPIRMVLNTGYNILDVKFIYEKNKINQFNFNFQNGNSEVILSFDYLDKHDGVIIQIVHTGVDSKDFDICGTVKGVGKCQSVSNQVSLNKFYSIVVTSLIAALIAITSDLVSSVLLEVLFRFSKVNNWLKIPIVNTSFSSLISVLMFYISLAIILHLSNKIPKEFNIFKDESWQF